MKLSLPIRITLAAASAIGYILIPYFMELVSLNESIESISYYLLSGLVFATGVLFPYVSRSKFRLWRALGLIAASAASYWCAVTIAIEGMGPAMSSHLSSYEVITGSVVGVLIVMGALLLLTPIRISVMYVVLGFLAGISGGLIMSYALDGDDMLTLVGYAGWHVLVCLAIYFGTPSTSAGKRFSAILFRRIGSV